MMTTDNGESTDTRKENQPPQTRGGAADVDRSKIMGNDELGNLFESSEKDTAEPKKEAPTGETP